MSLSICGTPPAVGGQQHPAHREHPRGVKADDVVLWEHFWINGAPPRVRGRHCQRRPKFDPLATVEC